MKVCVVSRGDIFPPNHGAAVKLYYTMTSIERRDNEVYFVTNENDHYYEVVDGEFKERQYPWFFRKVFGDYEDYKELVTWLGIPEKDWILYHPMVNLNMWLRTLYVVLREKIDIIQPEFPAFGFPALFAKLFTLKDVSMVEHNVEYFRIQESADNLTEKGRKILKLTEKFTCKLSDYVLPVSKEDAERLEDLGIDYSKVIPIGVDIGRFEDGDGERVRNELGIKENTNLLIYHGVMNYPPNIEAVNNLTEEVLPELREAKEDFKLLVVGGYPPEIDEDDVITTGFVGPLEDYIAAADLAVVPLESGGGLTMKMLEYFSSGTPVVCTEKALEGIHAKDGEHAVVSEIKDFSDEVLNLIKNKELQNELSGNAREFVEKFSWKNVAKIHEDLYEGK